MKTKRKSLWRLRTYDLWADGDGGYNVNDVYDQGLVTLALRLETFNHGTPFEFKSWGITDRSLNRQLGFRGIEWEGEVPGFGTSDGDIKIEYPVCLYGNFAKGKYAGSPAVELIFEEWC